MGYMAICSYNRNYLDFETGKGELFECTNDVWKRDKCKFHSKYYLKNSTKEEFELEFEKMLHSAMETGSLKCIGYHFPTIKLPKSDECDLDFVIYFTDAKFHGKNDFSNINFNKQISFTDATFYKSVIFRGTIFAEESTFVNTFFHGNINSFQFTKFEKKSNFSKGEIKNATFNHAQFHNPIFNYRVFHNHTSFTNSKFEKKSLFKIVTFYEVDFSESVFKDIVDFDNTKFYTYGIFSNITCSDQIKFNGNISNISFLDMDLQKIKFGNEVTWKQIKNLDAFWDKAKSYLNWMRNSDFKIYDERKLEKQLKRELWKLDNKETNLSLESIKNLYRDLRENFDYNLRYETSGEFHVREMELMRKYREKHKAGRIITTKKHIVWKHLSIFWLYNILAQYGQSYHRPIYFAIFVISIATYCFLSQEIESAKNADIEYSFLELLLKSITRSVAGFIPFDILDKTVSNVDKILRVVLLPISVTFFISLKRRLERKFRH